MSRPVVLRSINEEGGDRCVDLFRRADGSYGFEEFRRDPEDPRGWYPIGGFSDRQYAEEAETLAEARRAIPWFAALTA